MFISAVKRYLSINELKKKPMPLRIIARGHYWKTIKIIKNFRVKCASTGLAKGI